MIASDLLIVIKVVCVLHYIEQCKTYDFVGIGIFFCIRPQCTLGVVPTIHSL
jgi:hypothetical protein